MSACKAESWDCPQLQIHPSIQNMPGSPWLNLDYKSDIHFAQDDGEMRTLLLEMISCLRLFSGTSRLWIPEERLDLILDRCDDGCHPFPDRPNCSVQRRDLWRSNNCTTFSKNWNESIKTTENNSRRVHQAKQSGSNTRCLWEKDSFLVNWVHTLCRSNNCSGGGCRLTKCTASCQDKCL